MVARSNDGQITTWPIAENVHHNHILKYTTVPAKVSSTLSKKIIEIAHRMEHIFVELADNVNKLGELYFKNCVSKDSEIEPIYKNKEHKQRIQLFLQRMWENGIAV